VDLHPRIVAPELTSREAIATGCAIAIAARRERLIMRTRSSLAVCALGLVAGCASDLAFTEAMALRCLSTQTRLCAAHVWHEDDCDPRYDRQRYCREQNAR
jgi:hypothetical protein